MDNRWVVSEWIKRKGTTQYEYQEVYRGKSFWHMAIAAVKAKCGGAGCIKIEWR